ncbi:mandelate racemase/muconate lactonizing enzyme family protein [Marinovum sp. 2_MG-2023]|uniref:mandelate racemase/muconate lactonizing enzyme family protein n=1 Tax=unclassified Marinovum TaxID=2647166 RepID=UPI0026E3BDE1|nr:MULTISPECIES: mandelate racemase/muconate lactonizing enzyme family protein [unclassified Marinovum]MDO6729862.1 mandelate racemase/muconate lactonizing enzyme family protein [Marinovum sp. 2_MG-2023]MDO6779676.1 mandelate racemase/muconate lactonizing enzyme family protein [Marinovum sp. 1_MG-2023]
MTKFDTQLTLTAIEATLVRTPISTPVRTSFGIMHDRPTLLIRVTDASGVQGYGEVWCNFPVCGAEHRQRLVESEIAPRMVGLEFPDPAACYDAMNAKLRILRLQTGEPGPIAQIIAGVDIAVWDMIAKRNNQPLFALLGAKTNRMPAYASGINPVGVLDTVARARQKGHRNFKLKVGFGDDMDRANVTAIAGDLQAGERFLLDANQGWTPDQAEIAMQWITPHQPMWIEEPMAVDVHPAAWHILRGSTDVPIAGGENFQTRAEYDAVARNKWLDFVQPDIAKWGGFTECLPVAREAVANGLTFCPHSLGGGIALAASAHLLAAAGGSGLLECDANENDFRDEVFALDLTDGWVTLPDAPGLGVNIAVLERAFD